MPLRELKPDRWSGAKLPVGIVCIRGGYKKVSPNMHFPIATKEAWRLDRYHSVNVLVNDNDRGLIFLQLLENGDGKWKLSRNKRGMISFSAGTLCKELKLRAGRYFATRKQTTGLVCIDIENQWGGNGCERDNMSLEELVEEFARKFHRKGPTDLNDKTIAKIFASELEGKIRKHATAKKQVQEQA